MSENVPKRPFYHFCGNIKMRGKSFHLNIFLVMLELERERLGVANRMERCQAKSYVTISGITSSFHIFILVNHNSDIKY